MVITSSPESVNVVPMDLQMSDKLHDIVWADAKATLYDLTRRHAQPNLTTETYFDIPVTGQVPLSLQWMIGKDFRSLTASKTDIHDAPQSPRLDLKLTGKKHQTSISSLTEGDISGRSAIFNIANPRANAAPTLVDGANLCMTLDELLPRATNKFGELVDPRKNISSKQMVHGLGKLLLGLSTSTGHDRTFTAKNIEAFGFSEEEAKSLLGRASNLPRNSSYISEFGARLVHKSVNRQGSEEGLLRLTNTFPFDVGDDNIVWKQFEYTAPINPKYRRSARLILMSSDISTPHLKRYMRDAWRDDKMANPAKLALAEIRSEHLGIPTDQPHSL